MDLTGSRPAHSGVADAQIGIWRLRGPVVVVKMSAGYYTCTAPPSPLTGPHSDSQLVRVLPSPRFLWVVTGQSPQSPTPTPRGPSAPETTTPGRSDAVLPAPAAPPPTWGPSVRKAKGFRAASAPLGRWGLASLPETQGFHPLLASNYFGYYS